MSLKLSFFFWDHNYKEHCLHKVSFIEINVNSTVQLDAVELKSALLLLVCLRMKATKPILTKWLRRSRAAEKEKLWACSARTNSQESIWKAGMMPSTLRAWKRFVRIQSLISLPTVRAWWFTLFFLLLLMSRWTLAPWLHTQWQWRRTESLA